MESVAVRETILRTIETVEDRLEPIGDHLVHSYQSDIVDYRALDEQALRGDVRQTAQRNVQELLAALRDEAAPTDTSLEALRRSARRRVHQGISLQALLHAYRLWGQVVWQEILGVSDPEVAAEREAALIIAGRVMAYVDQVSVAVAQTYLDEVTGVLGDREAMRRDLLEALISGRPISERMRQRASASNLDVGGAHAVVLARLLEPGGSERAVLRAAVTEARKRLRPDNASILVGIREDEVVIICPATDASGYTTLVQQAGEWAAQLSDFAVGVGRVHSAMDGIAQGYAEAEQAVRLGAARGAHAKAITFSDVLLDQLLSSSSHLGALHDETMRPLHEYDRERDSQLVRTLRAYYEHGFSLAKSAAELSVNPNTIVYRLRRIQQLTGHDPNDPDELLLLVLGLKSDRWAEG
ncbi:CdaR family transcriptional regulator [Tamaricihabitans halophyticus]|uniref:CdaR family transcriptional regulator n=1 Tax=Tamaricihabitans halophyticus TaxID=1262583 RepID=A0A4R2R6S3_9PSEU|nr:PucR family transcriptional regulator [Tamaricihabitans halophyticus]TCP55331.1 CdaR family transcriptional regulator [Tamaricihabitans halophyticus]